MNISNTEFFNINTVESFIEFEKQQKKSIRGNTTMYDIVGSYKYLTLSELFEWYIKHK